MNETHSLSLALADFIPSIAFAAGYCLLYRAPTTQSIVPLVA